jgi:hypothetical protein
MRKWLCALVFLGCLIIASSRIVRGDSYLTYQDIVFDSDDARLLSDYRPDDYQTAYAALAGRRFFGWRHVVVHNQEQVEFIAETKLKIHNAGFSTIKHDISLSTQIETKFQVAASGTIDIEVKGDVKKFKGALDAEIKASIQYSKTTTTKETYDFQVIVDPGTRVVIRSRGEGRVSSGVARHYAFWIMTNEGGWETFTITTEYFEIIKERLR